MVRAISDLSEKRRALAGSRCPGARIVSEASELFADPRVDAVAIATPISTHFALATAALRAGKHVMVEKPMTTTGDEARALIAQAEAAHRVLMVDHTFVYTGAVRKIKEMLSEGALGDVLYYDSVRVNLGLFQHDVNVVWDLAVHDLSILQYLLAQVPSGVSAFGVSHVAGQPENMAYVTLMYETSTIAHLHLNWLAPVKIRQTLIGGTRRMIVYDDLQASEKVKVYDKGVELETRPEGVYELRVGYRSGDMHCPKIEQAEALQVEVKHFADCIEHGKRPLTDGQAGLGVVQILEAAQRSMQDNGRLVPIGRSA